MLEATKAVRRKILRLIYGPEFELWPSTTYPSVKTTYWHPPRQVNFGDELARIIVQLMLARQGYTPFDETVEARQLLTVGSVMHFAANGATIWGTGVNGATPAHRHRFSDLDIRAVRGPHSREWLMSRGFPVPEIYGDPALLLPHIAPGRFKRSSLHRVGFVPNLHDLGHVPADFRLISPLQSWNACIDQILQCDFIVASSLHGLVIAEAYGIPARYVRLTPTEGIFKYNDYYEGTGRQAVDFATTIDQAVEMGGAAPLAWDPAPLLEAFPYDLWKQQTASATR